MSPLRPMSLVSKKNYGVAIMLSVIFGLLGLHHAYLQRWDEAALDLGLLVTSSALLESHPMLAAVVLAIDVAHATVVTALLITGNFRDGDGRIVAYPGQFS